MLSQAAYRIDKGGLCARPGVSFRLGFEGSFRWRLLEHEMRDDPEADFRAASAWAACCAMVSVALPVTGVVTVRDPVATP